MARLEGELIGRLAYDLRNAPARLPVAVIAQVLLISAQVQTKSGVRAIEAVSFGLFARVQSAASSSVRGVRDVWTNYAALRGARDENETLKKQLAELSVELQQQRGLAARAGKFQELLDLKTSIDLPTVAAEVIAGNANPGMRQITIGRGTADGVQANMAVISPRGVVGRIVGQPAAHAARVQLIIDHSAAAGALTERTRAGGMVIGVDRQPPLAMELVSNLADVKAERRGGDIGRRRHLPEGLHDRVGRQRRPRSRTLPGHRRAPGGGFLQPGRGARRGGALAARIVRHRRETATPPRTGK